MNSPEVIPGFGSSVSKRLGYDAIVVLQGWDGAEDSFWHWVSSEGGDDGAYRIDLAELNGLLHELRLALPGVRMEDSSADIPAPPPGFEWTPNADLAMVLRVGDGALGDPKSESELSRRLSELLLPGEFLARLRELVVAHPDQGSDKRVCLRIGSSAASAVVPWGLLRTRDPAMPDERLLELVDVVDMPPLVERDSNSALRAPSWEDVRHLPPLYVIDPRPDFAETQVPIRRVLGVQSHRHWRDRVESARTQGTPAGRSTGWVDEPVTRNDLSDHLRGADAPTDRSVRSARSRLLYVGHVSTVEAQLPEGLPPERTVELELFEHHKYYGVVSEAASTPREGPAPAPGSAREPIVRGLSANDLLLGTCAYDEHCSDLKQHLHPPTAAPGEPDERRQLALEYEFGADGPVFPPCVTVTDGRPEPIEGRIIWPMPLRVGIVACASGTDLESLEPFGLVTAVLEGGAEHVIATRWTLLVDAAAKLYAAIRRTGYSGTDEFDQLARAVDDALTEDDLVRAANRYQRRRLAVWRSRPSFQTSPALWGSLAIFHAPRRGPLDPVTLRESF